MSEPVIKRYPVEIFGYPYTNSDETVQEVRKNQHCPFLNAECKKPRKSQPHIKIGICSVGYKAEFEDSYHPVIICPHRFDSQIVSQIVKNYYLSAEPGQRIEKLDEVMIDKTIGSVDHVFVKLSGKPESYQIDDFICIEIQAAGTTGTPWQAFLDYQQHGRFVKDKYKYGINWANEFAKTMMQQAYKKGLIIEKWGKKVVFIVQDIAIRYLENSYDVSGLHPARSEDAIQFCTVRMNWNKTLNQWQLQPHRQLSTNTEGVRKLLSGIHPDNFTSRQEFEAKILSKLRS